MIKLLEHPLLRSKLNRIRDKNTPSYELRSLVEEMTTLALPLLIDGIPTVVRRIETPLEAGEFELIREEDFILVPILRAGLPMLNGALRVFPRALVGFLAIKRDEKTLRSKVYYSRLPEGEGRTVIILDPMLATGGTLELAVEEVKKIKPTKIYTLHLIASPEGIRRFESSDAVVCVVQVDRGLNSKGYIVPGVGDLGDRLFTPHPPDSPWD